MLGAVFHLILDIPMHPSNPVLWPWVNPYEIVGILVPLLGFGGANLLLSVATGICAVAILLRYMDENLWEKVWLGDN
jgi:membrane-bound metal-dependent hydrolase YbcI (DUF457 family)